MVTERKTMKMKIYQKVKKTWKKVTVNKQFFYPIVLSTDSLMRISTETYSSYYVTEEEEDDAEGEVEGEVEDEEDDA